MREAAAATTEPNQKMRKQTPKHQMLNDMTTICPEKGGISFSRLLSTIPRNAISKGSNIVIQNACGPRCAAASNKSRGLGPDSV